LYSTSTFYVGTSRIEWYITALAKNIARHLSCTFFLWMQSGKTSLLSHDENNRARKRSMDMVRFSCN